MPLTCPRCETNVPDEALYCPYCNLPKPKSGFVAADHKKAEETAPNEPKSPVVFRKTGTAASNRVASSSPSKSLSRARKPARRLRLPVLTAAALVPLLCVGAYMYVLPLVRSQGPEPKTALAALDKLRHMPSNEPGVTIDARMTRELERLRKARNLVSYQGWTVQPIKGTTTKALLIFSYQEVGDVQHRAEWVADLTNNTFTPQTELAAAIYGKQ